MNGYVVSWGWNGASAEFDWFSDALTCYIDHLADDVRIVGRGYDVDFDGDSYVMIDDGLTGLEREAVEAAQEMAA